MKVIAVIGPIGSGKSHISNMLSRNVFNADKEVINIYKKNKKCYKLLNRSFPNYVNKFPIDKKDLQKIILKNVKNIIKIGEIVHPFVRIKLKKFLKKNIKKKLVVLDIPLLLENKIKVKNLILVYVYAKKSKIIKKLKERPNFNKKLYKIMDEKQFNSKLKKKSSDYIIKNNFTMKYVEKQLNDLKKDIAI